MFDAIINDRCCWANELTHAVFCIFDVLEKIALCRGVKDTFRKKDKASPPLICWMIRAFLADWCQTEPVGSEGGWTGEFGQSGPLECVGGPEVQLPLSRNALVGTICAAKGKFSERILFCVGGIHPAPGLMGSLMFGSTFPAIVCPSGKLRRGVGHFPGDPRPCHPGAPGAYISTENGGKFCGCVAFLSEYPRPGSMTGSFIFPQFGMQI